MPGASLEAVTGRLGIGAIAFLGLFLIADGLQIGVFEVVEVYGKSATWGLVGIVPTAVVIYIVGRHLSRVRRACARSLPRFSGTNCRPDHCCVSYWQPPAPAGVRRPYTKPRTAQRSRSLLSGAGRGFRRGVAQQWWLSHAFVARRVRSCRAIVSIAPVCPAIRSASGGSCRRRARRPRTLGLRGSCCRCWNGRCCICLAHRQQNGLLAM